MTKQEIINMLLTHSTQEVVDMFTLNELRSIYSLITDGYQLRASCKKYEAAAASRQYMLSANRGWALLGTEEFKPYRVHTPCLDMIRDAYETADDHQLFYKLPDTLVSKAYNELYPHGDKTTKRDRLNAILHSFDKERKTNR